MGIGVKFSFYSYSLWRAIFFSPLWRSISFFFSHFHWKYILENIYVHLFNNDLSESIFLNKRRAKLSIDYYTKIINYTFIHV